MRKIWKYEFAIKDEVQIWMPSDSKVLAAAVQDQNEGLERKACLWAELDPNSEFATRSFAVVGTGRPIPEGAKWVATFLDPPFVWHLYEATK